MRDLIIIGELQVWPRDLGEMTWDEAMVEVTKLGPGWRLPTLDEFKETLYPGRSGILGLADDDYWSNTKYYANYSAWYFNFSNGQFHYTSNKNPTFYVLAVRDFGGETALEILLKDF
jgi:hypothetical protein